MAERHAESDRRGRLALAERGGGDRRDDDVLGLRAVLQSIFATCSPCCSVSQGGMPTSSAISVIGLSVACREISSAVGMAM
jgi:hypothetical protein